MTQYTVLPIIMPSDLKDAKNGELNPTLLRDVKAPHGKMHHLAGIVVELFGQQQK